MAALSFVDSKGPNFNSPVIYNSAVESLQKCNDDVLQRISYLTRYLYAQHLYRYHYYDVNGTPSGEPISDFIVSGAISTYTLAGDGKINIGLAKNTVRTVTANISLLPDDTGPPPGADLKDVPFPPSEFTDTNHNLYQYGGIVPSPNATTLNSDGYLIYDSNYGIGTNRGSLRVAGGTTELDIVHTIIRDVLKQLDNGDNLGSYYIESEERINQSTLQPEPAGQDAGTWFNCGEFLKDTLFDPQFATTVEQQTLYDANPSAFPVIELPYNIYLKTNIDTESFFYPSGINGLMRYDTTESPSGIKEFNPNFDTSQVYFSPSSDTLSSAPNLYKNILLPILFRNYPRYILGGNAPAQGNKGFIQDYIWKDDVRVYRKDTPIGEVGGTYTAITEPRFTDALTGKYLGREEPGFSRQNYFKYPNSGGVYYLNTQITYN